jgi:drug/metabolite transporter (DMT)-like permease
MNLKTANRHVRGALLITAAMLIFSGVGPFVRFVSLPVTVIMCCTSGLAAVLLLCWFMFRGDVGSLNIRGQRRWIVLSAFSLFGNVFCFYQAYRLTTMANAVITHYTAPVFAALLAPILLGEKWERVTGVALIISTAGLILIADDVAPGQAHLAGTALGLASGFFYGFSIVLGKKLLRSYRPPVIMLYQCAIIACLALPFALLAPWGLTTGKLLGLCTYALLVCLLAAGLYLRGLRHVEAQHAGILAYSELLFVVLLGVLLGETPGVSVVAGGFLIAVSGFIILRAESRRA